LYQPTEVFAGSVAWSFGNGPRGSEIIARVEVAERNVSLELHIWRTDDAYNIDLRTTSFSSTPGGFDPHRISVFASSDNVVARDQTMIIVDPATELRAEPDIDRHRINEPDVRLLASRDLIELFDFSRPSPLVLEIGESGRAAFAEAFAGWGIAP
jgi:hypothetical protein